MGVKEGSGGGGGGGRGECEPCEVLVLRGLRVSGPAVGEGITLTPALPLRERG